jgi:hypothetical protein
LAGNVSHRQFGDGARRAYRWCSMIVPSVMLASLVALIPALGMLDGVGMIGAVSAMLAAALMVLSIALPAASLVRFTRMLRPVVVVVLAAPALWMILQIIPMPAGALVNPIWASASAALHQRFAGTITVDVGATLLSLAQYCAVIAAALVTAAVTLDRQRARHVLYILMVITALVAARQIAQELALLDHLSLGESGDGRSQALVIAVAGIVLSCGTAIHAVDQLQQTGRSRPSTRSSIFTLSGAMLSLFICAAAILVRVSPAVFIAALLGAGTLLAVYAIRQWLLGPWGAAGLAAAAAIGLFGIFAVIPADKADKNVDLTVPFSTQNQTAFERMVSDAAPAGSGAGTFKALLPFYQELGTTASPEHPTAAAAIMVEMGPAFLCGMIAVALFGAWTLFSRSLARGQDYVYAAAGAGALIASPVMALAGDGILTLGASLLGGVLCGLGFAQSLSGANRDVLSFELQVASDEADQRRDKRRSAPLALDKTLPRVALALFGLVLCMQAGWILSAERYSLNHFRLSTEKNVASIEASRDQIRKAASIAAVRGDLWADNAFALVPQPWTDPAAGLERNSIPEPALSALTRALHYSPHRGDVWLMLAAFADRYRPAGYDTGALLKMSYYTAPNALGLVPLRLYVALRTNAAASELELSDMIKRDIKLVLTHQPTLRPALVAAYNSASANGKIFAEQLISEIDPVYLKSIRAQYR